MVQDVDNVMSIYGRDIGETPGKTDRKQPDRMAVQIPDPIPTVVTNRLQKLIMSADIAFVDGMKVFTTITKRLQFTTIQTINDRKMDTMKECFHNIVKMYRSHGAKISVIVTD